MIPPDGGYWDHPGPPDPPFDIPPYDPDPSHDPIWDAIGQIIDNLELIAAWIENHCEEEEEGEHE